jgi:arabinogalactan endo-1,4-beta-galactosidase
MNLRVYRLGVTGFFFGLLVAFIISCSSESGNIDNMENESADDGGAFGGGTTSAFYYGADLSYVNEMEDCGARFKNKQNETEDPFKIFADVGTNLIRVRKWHAATWTNYSNFEDVEKTIRRAKDKNIAVLLDFHYSDEWADPNKQEIPVAWLLVKNNTQALGDSIYNYTYKTLEKLSDNNLLPEIVQIGNEINGMILQEGALVWPIDWARNAVLLNKGIQAVRDLSAEKKVTIEVMLHVAQPENALWWFKQAKDSGVTDFDWIGLSYYPSWSTDTFANLPGVLSTIKNTYNKRFMIVETAYPFTLENGDDANNILGNDALIAGYPATQQGQLAYLQKLQGIIENAGGEGLVYWEPAWVSTPCSTLWAQGSHWDNATLFDHDYKVTLGMSFYNNSL